MVDRASTSEIQQHLFSLLGSQAQDIALQSSHLFEMGRKKEGLALLKKYDAGLGGTGIYQIQNKKLPGVYRALTYTWMPLQGDHPERLTRSMIHSACCYLEELLKKIARVWPWEDIKADSLPLGTLVRKAQKRLPIPLFDELIWLSDRVYNPAKHHYNLEDDGEGDDEPECYFNLADALAVYLIVRKLGLELEKMVPSFKQ